MARTAKMLAQTLQQEKQRESARVDLTQKTGTRREVLIGTQQSTTGTTVERGAAEHIKITTTSIPPIKKEIRETGGITMIQERRTIMNLLTVVTIITRNIREIMTTTGRRETMMTEKNKHRGRNRSPSAGSKSVDKRSGSRSRSSESPLNKEGRKMVASNDKNVRRSQSGEKAELRLESKLVVVAPDTSNDHPKEKI